MSAPRFFSLSLRVVTLAAACAGMVTASPSNVAAQIQSSALTLPSFGGEEQNTPPAKPKPPETDAAKPAKKPSKPPVIRIAGFFETGYQGLVAKDTFDAVLGKSGGSLIGGGVSLTHESGILVQVDATRFKAAGERVFVYGGNVFPLGIPLSVKMTPIEVTGGYKFFVRQPKPKTKAPGAPGAKAKPSFQPAKPVPGEGASSTTREPASTDQPAGPAAPGVTRAPKKPRWGGLKPYVGGGFGVVKYEETSDFAATGDDVKDSYTSYHALGGLDIPIWKWIGAAAEFNYRWVKDALGKDGVSKAFGEDDLGGPSFRIKITIGG